MSDVHALSLRDALIVAAAAALLIVTPLGRHLVAYSGEARMALLARDRMENDEAIERTQNFRVVAAALVRHAAGGDMRLFSASLLLPIDFYAGRQIERMLEIQELRDYLARPDRPVALIDRRYWRDFQAKMPPDLAVLEKIPVQGQELYIVRAGAGR